MTLFERVRWQHHDLPAALELGLDGEERDRERAKVRYGYVEAVLRIGPMRSVERRDPEVY